MKTDLRTQSSELEQNRYPPVDDEIDLGELLSVIWRGKWIIAVITFLFVLFSVIFALKQPNLYRSEVLLAPAEAKSNGGLSALAGQFGGLASLAGVNIGGQSTNKTQLALEVLKSRKFVASFIEKHNILPDLMAVESWDIDKGVLYDPEVYDSSSKKWLRDVEAPRIAKPSDQEAYKIFSDLILLKTNKETAMITLSIVHQSPLIAKQWVNWLVKDINKEMRDRDVVEAQKSADFLSKQLEDTKIADIRIILYKLIEEQAKTIMFASVRDEYAFKTIDPALVPEVRDSPKRTLIVILGFALGLVFSCMIVILKHYIRIKD
ncbi:Wzz/FepE/Etk N-terminal domain-containing protein [Pseudoalteromonas carrageenovora]|uniref:LPS O-antigen length regulator n=1 Tax=Pseudoalteromonas carrageenovora IAM 12662 TaxID=1314868 RepID=A0A2K4X609_PSEVC|nr:Wzz/FepE/Etk N-terminal domain-containing protein [Pseudoalteromonas carrageenovora]SOU39723.1 LPS O-antigen length regulator [Pseudoalteromonas carrageenovora IAM 12662]